MFSVSVSLWLATQFLAIAPVPQWNSDYARAVRVARSQHQPLVVILEDRSQEQRTASVLDHPMVKQTLRDCSVCRLDVRTRTGARLASQLNARDFPYTVVSDRSARTIVFRGAGEFNKDTWLGLLEDVIDPPSGSHGAEKRRQNERTDVLRRAGADTSTVESPKLRVVVVSSDGCAYCEKLKAETLPHPAVGRVLNNDMSLEYVNASEDDSLARKHDVMVYPSILVLEDDELLDKIDGFVGPGELVDRLQACSH
jgi:hypothetical protein